MRVKVIVQPSGCINGNYWPEAGGSIDLPDAVAASMIAAGDVEAVKTESKPKVEKRPAPVRAETRKG